MRVLWPRVVRLHERRLVRQLLLRGGRGTTPQGHLGRVRLAASDDGNLAHTPCPHGPQGG
jgi:hypothetical protein